MIKPLDLLKEILETNKLNDTVKQQLENSGRKNLMKYNRPTYKVMGKKWFGRRTSSRRKGLEGLKDM